MKRFFNALMFWLNNNSDVRCCKEFCPTCQYYDKCWYDVEYQKSLNDLFE